MKFLFVKNKWRDLLHVLTLNQTLPVWWRTSRLQFVSVEAEPWINSLKSITMNLQGRGTQIWNHFLRKTENKALGSGLGDCGSDPGQVWPKTLVGTQDVRVGLGRRCCSTLAVPPGDGQNATFDLNRPVWSLKITYWSWHSRVINSEMNQTKFRFQVCDGNWTQEPGVCPNSFRKGHDHG